MATLPAIPPRQRLSRQVTLRVCPEQWGEVERVATASGVSTAEAVRFLLERCLRSDGT